MKRLKLFSILLLLSIVIVGCTSGSNNDLNKEDVLVKVEEQSKDLQSVTAEVDFEIENTANNQSEKLLQNIEAVVLYGKGGTITHTHTKQGNISADNSQQNIEFYKTPEVAYLFDGMMWQKYSGSESYATTYKPLMDTLIDSSDELEMKEEDNHYIFSFKGKNPKLYNFVKIPFSISFEGLDENLLDLDVSFKVKKNTMHIEDVLIGASYTLDESNKSSIAGDVKFSKFNETKDIKIPEEVKNQ